MIYPANFEEKIGFDRIREQVTALCSTPSAKAKLAEEGFSTSADEIERRLSLMNEMRSLLMLERDFPDGDYPDPAPLVAKIRVEGSYLLAAEADQLRKALVTVGAIAEFILGRGGARYPRLWELSRRVTLFPEIVRAIDAILDDHGEVKDSASPELQQVRRAIREREGQAAKRLQQVLQRAKQAGIVDADAVLSVRDGRPVIPVAAANKRKLQGFIHDESATGRTFYVEPVEVVEINNELKELEYAERREVVKVLSAFTESIRPDAEVIADAGDYLSSVDMIRAKARWALANDAEVLLMDEPTSALDPISTSKIEDLAEELKENYTIVMVTHNMQNAIEYGNRLIMMHNGGVILDVGGEEKKKLTVEALLKKFEQVSGTEFANDSALLG